MTTREKQLGAGMVAVLGLVGLVFGFSKVNAWREVVERRAVAIELEEVEAGQLLAERGLWEQRAAHLDSELPAYPGRGDAVAELLSALEESARAAGLEISNQRITELEASPHYRSSVCELEVQGLFDAVGRWIVTIQGQRPFREVGELRLVGNKQQKAAVTGTVRVVQYYQPKEEES